MGHNCTQCAWLYEHLRPFLSRMTPQMAALALRECIERGYLTEEHAEGIAERLAADHVRSSTTKKAKERKHGG